MQDDILNNPHDKFFKESFSRKEVAASFIKEYLPQTLHSKMQLDTLKILKDSFIDKELSEHFSDILYSLRIAGKSSFVYLLFEHKSYIDTWTNLQLLRNMVKIWELFRKQHPVSKKLPVVVPIVIYHGQQKWNVENSLAQLFDTDENTRLYVPAFKSEVFDISHIPDNKIKGEILLRVHFMVQKYIGSPQFIDKLGSIFEMLVTLSNKTRKTEFLETLLRYLVVTVDDTQMPELKKHLEKKLEDGGNIMPTIAEKWVQQGVEKGIEKGKIEDALKMIEMGMNDKDIRIITGLSSAKILHIRKHGK